MVAGLSPNLPKIGAPLKAHTHLVVREDAQFLVGFPTREERNLFRVLLSASGVGPKLALAVMSAIPMEELVATIAHGNTDRLKGISGVGSKTAQRIVIELKEKMVKTFAVAPVKTFAGVATEEPVIRDALSALMSLGYSAREARQAIDDSKLDPRETSLEKLLKEALKTRFTV